MSPITTIFSYVLVVMSTHLFHPEKKFAKFTDLAELKKMPHLRLAMTNSKQITSISVDSRSFIRFEISPYISHRIKFELHWTQNRLVISTSPLPWKLRFHSN